MYVERDVGIQSGENFFGRVVKVLPTVIYTTTSCLDKCSTHTPHYSISDVHCIAK
jgi:hypothetical protein